MQKNGVTKMKLAHEILSQNLKQKNFGLTPKPESKPQPDAVTTRLFAKLGLLYGHKWVSIYPDQDVLVEAEKAWGEALAGFSLDDIKRGIDKSVDVYPSWPPTVGEFKKLCQVDPSSIGLPSVETAFREVTSTTLPFGETSKVYSHGLILAIINDDAIDTYNLSRMPSDKSMKIFKPIYNKYVSRAIAGEEFELPIMIENKVGRPVTKEERLEAHGKWFADLKGAIEA